MTKALDIAHWRFGKLVALGRVANTADGKAQWVCTCDCGGAHIVRGTDLTSGRVTKCPACERVRESVHLDLWCYVSLLPHEAGGYVQGSAGFVVATRGGRELMMPVWTDARHIAKRDSPVLVAAVRALAKAGHIRSAPDLTSLSGWIRRHKADITRNTFNEGDKVWAAWYARTSEWKGPQQSGQQLDTIMSSLQGKSA